MSSGFSVLVVDDDPSIRLLCRVNLELDGHAIREAATLDEARAVLAAHLVDVLLLDVHVGAGDGVAFLDEVRRERPALPVAMLTGSVDVGGLQRERDVAVIAKPFTLEKLRETVQQLAANVDLPA